MKIGLKFAGILASMSLVMATAFSVSAAEYDVATMPAQPAELTDNNSSIQNRIQFPDINEDVYALILCHAHLTDDGNFNYPVYCFRDIDVEKSIRNAEEESTSSLANSDAVEVEVTAERNDWLEERFEREVVEAARNSRISPATMEGRRREVKLNFSVIFEKKDGVESIEVFLHHFRNYGILGTDYIAAQRFSSRRSLFEEERPVECPMLHVPVWIEAYVETTGSAFDASLFDFGLQDDEVTESSIDRCADSFVELIKENLFVPTIFYGQYISGTYIELFYDDVRDENALTNTDTRDRVVSEWQNGGENIEGWSFDQDQDQDQ